MTNLLEISPASLDTQKLLFDITPFSQGFGQSLDTSAFIRDGYAIINDVQDEFEAIQKCYEFICSLRPTGLFYDDHLPFLQLSKGDLIPTCLPFVEGGFQALHFDYGLPLIAVEEEEGRSLDIIAALYFPFSAGKSSGAATRVVKLSRIAEQVKGRFDDVENKIINYVEHHGDGWTTPTPYNTKRISILARILDACSGNNDFLSRIDYHSQNFFLPEGNIQDAGFPMAQLEMERQYYKQFGIDLAAVEEQIVLRPGQLLLIDNIRTVHGRTGFRNPKELWQFLYSLKKAPVELIDETRRYVSEVLTGSGTWV